MGRGNAFLNQLARQRAFDDACVRTATQRYVLDMVTVALGRLGWARSEVRLKQFADMMETVTKEYAELVEWEKKADKGKEFVLMKEKLDAEIKTIAGSMFMPYEERHLIREEELRL